MRINLQGERVALALVLIALFAQMPHAASVFHRLAPAGEMAAWLHAAVFAVAVESATLFFVLRGKKLAAYLFATASVAINLAYYQIWLADDLWTVAVIVLVSTILPIAIAAYSHFAATAPHKAATAPKPAKTTTNTTKPAKARKAPETSNKARAIQMLQDDPTITKTAIAKTLGVSRPTVAKYLNGVK